MVPTYEILGFMATRMLPSPVFWILSGEGREGRLLPLRIRIPSLVQSSWR
jgi:hypothetical protein